MRMRIILVLAFFALMFACSTATAYFLLSTSYTSSSAGFFYTERYGHITVTAVAPGELTGLHVGDEIVEFNGLPVTAASQLRRFFVIAKAETPYDVVVNRGGNSQRLTLRTRPSTMPMRLGVYASVLLIPFFFHITGLIIFLLGQHFHY